MALAACGGGSSGTSPVTTAPAGVSATPTAGPPSGVQQFAGLSRQHTTADVKYDQDPPVGGDHDPVWQPCAFYNEPIRTERGVHSMEHGAVWITFSSDLAADQIAKLKAMVNGHDHLLITPYPDLPSPLVATAWGEQLKLQSVDDPRLAQFIDYFEQGPQTPEPGAACA
jgi:hypothetical protein